MDQRRRDQIIDRDVGDIKESGDAEGKDCGVWLGALVRLYTLIGVMGSWGRRTTSALDGVMCDGKRVRRGSELEEASKDVREARFGRRSSRGEVRESKSKCLVRKAKVKCEVEVERIGACGAVESEVTGDKENKGMQRQSVDVCASERQESRSKRRLSPIEYNALRSRAQVGKTRATQLSVRDRSEDKTNDRQCRRAATRLRLSARAKATTMEQDEDDKTGNENKG
ncbi:hypothetical protein FA95DRAFT_1600099 [Auriscalpium vulgare]|uniref:Uncharacterized protein n=1 Tax=Auriscalpium vulgare TaxID=40419 RepID=A0ACB8R3P8_9AGAM|nr:hypothetical protein FA95DRAFT_1600099 [Auriscalpium vulgare]